MTTETSRKKLPLLGHFALLGCGLAGVWLAAGFILPSAESIMQPQGTRIPAFCNAAFRIQAASFEAVYPVAYLGAALLVIGLLRRGPTRLVSGCRTALPLLSGSVVCLSIYLLSSAGIAYKLASLDLQLEIASYRGTLEEFSLVEAAQGRIERLRKIRNIKVVEVRSVSDFSRSEAFDRKLSLLAGIRTAEDPGTKRRLLATLALFRHSIKRDSAIARDIPRYAAEVGAPPSSSPGEALDWIAANLHKDGWEPVPLFKLSL